MSKILLDTNAYSELLSGNKLVFDIIIESEIIYISTIMLGELYGGFYGGKRYSENIEILQKFLSKEEIKIINVTKTTSEIFGEVKASLSKKGTMLPINDIWIAAHAIEYGAQLVTFDKHFENIDLIRLWNRK